MRLSGRQEGAVGGASQDRRGMKGADAQQFARAAARGRQVDRDFSRWAPLLVFGGIWSRCSASSASARKRTPRQRKRETQPLWFPHSPNGGAGRTVSASGLGRCTPAPPCTSDVAETRRGTRTPLTSDCCCSRVARLHVLASPGRSPN
jgi:hypothetical protein